MNTEPESKNLQDTFSAKSEDKVEQNYINQPDQTASLVNGLRHLLSPSITARRLLQMADEQGVTFRMLRGPKETVYVPEGKWIFITTTPHTQASPKLALLYAGAIREVEHNILGFTRPGPDASDQAWVEANLAKNLDIIKNMCYIVKEIIDQNQDVAGFLDSLNSLGHSNIYKGFINQSSDEDLIKLLAIQEGLKINEG